MKTYTARLEREEDGRWSVELEEEPRVHTWGRTVDQALARVREATALWFQADEASIGLVPRPVLPKSAATAIDQARQARAQARSADRLAMDKTKRAVTALTGRGVSLRDAAAIIGISHQRVHQLLTPGVTPRPNRPARPSRPVAAPRAESQAEIRQWARAQGYAVGDRGRLPAGVQMAYGSSGARRRKTG
jgi:predicted RNase H-like HicB family nuclease/DNA-binding CsgD family transcriptional regulator